MSKILKLRKWAINHGSPFQKKDAHIIGSAIEALESKIGVITPKVVVQVARNRKHALHRFFEWDDEVASDKWRLHQARNLIGAVHIVVETPTGPMESRAYPYLQLEGKNRGDYMSLDNIMSHKEFRERYVRQALQEGEQWMQRYKNVRELASVFAVLQNKIRSISKKQRKTI